MADLDMSTLLSDDANKLLVQLANSIETGSGLSLMGNNLYDSAWVSMVHKDVDGMPRQAFPLAYNKVLNEQSRTRGWHPCGTEADLILINAACLLALLHHRVCLPDKAGPKSSHTVREDDLIQDTKTFLEQRLNNLDPNAVEAVGFELLLPGLLAMIDNLYVKLDPPPTDYTPFKSRLSSVSAMDTARQAILARVDFEQLYAANRTTKLHSLEAFVGHLDYSRLEHCINRDGGMMGSPSSTAAYLMNASKWDTRAEAFLQRTHGSSGGYPGAFPTLTWESAWMLSTLMSSSFAIAELQVDVLDKVAQFLREQLIRNAGVVGFSPDMVDDADDTGKAIYSLSLLRKHSKSSWPENELHALRVGPMVKKFWNPQKRCFRTYTGERNTSFSANCNVLTALLTCSDPSRYWIEITATLDWLFDAFDWPRLQDKWNNSTLYSYMGFAQVLSIFAQESEKVAPLMLTTIPTRRYTLTVAKLLSRILEGQESNGAWSHECPGSFHASLEPTSYALLALCTLMNLRLPGPIKHTIRETMLRGFRWLAYAYRMKREDSAIHFELEYLWIGKVTYASPRLNELFCLSALKACLQYLSADGISPMRRVEILPRTPTAHRPALTLDLSETNSSASISRTSEDTPNTPDLSPSKSSGASSNGIASLLGQIPLFSRKEPTSLEEHSRVNSLLSRSVMESKAYLPRISQRVVELGLNNTPSHGSDEKLQEYISFIPAVWVAVQNHLGVQIEHDILLYMMIISLLTYQIDEFMDEVVSAACARRKGTMIDVKKLITTLCDPSLGCYSDTTPGRWGMRAPELQDIETRLESFVAFVLQHELVRSSSKWMQHYLVQNLRDFLLAHLDQINVNLTYRVGVKDTLFSWLRGSSAESTSGPYAFAFFMCLISGQDDVAFASVHTKYLLEDVARHLSTRCRMCNDYGSLARDRDEHELNALDFPEFAERETRDSSTAHTGNGEGNSKADLLALADYEQQGLDHALQSLSLHVDDKVMTKIQLFVGVTEVYNQIYLKRDLSKRKS